MIFKIRHPFNFISEIRYSSSRYDYLLKVTMIKFSSSAMLIFFAILVFLGFMPWESIFSIEFRGAIIEFLTSATLGYIGVLGLLTIAIFKIRQTNSKFTFAVIAGCLVVIVLALFCLTINVIIPDFKWKDDSIYKSGNEYLVLEEYQGFVTNSTIEPRVLFTKAPYAAIRKIDIVKGAETGLIRGDSLIYLKRVWRKQTVSN